MSALPLAVTTRELAVETYLTTMVLTHLSSHTRAFATVSLIALYIIDYNSLTHCSKVIILVPNDSSLQQLFNGIISFDICSTLAEI